MRAAAGFGMEVTREAIKRGVRISAGSDHVADGPAAERATLFGELQLYVDSIGMTPTAALLAATRDAARAIGGEAGRTDRDDRCRDTTRTWCWCRRIRWRTSGTWSTWSG